MANKGKNPTVKPKNKKETLTHPAVGIWKDKWPKEKSSVEVAKELRKKQWQRY